MMKLKPPGTAIPSAVCLLALNLHPQLSTQVFAASADYSIIATAQLEHIDNPQRLPDNERDELARQAILQGIINRSTNNFSTNIDYSARKIDYKNDLLRDRTLVTGSSAFRWSPTPVFAWNLSNIRSFQQVDALQPDITDNRQVVEITSTGPELTFQLTGSDRLSGQYNYSWANYETSDLSGQERQSVAVQYSHAFSGRLNAFINLDALDSQFNSDTAPEFKRYNYSVGSSYTAESYSLSAEAGETQSKLEGLPDQTGLLLRLDGDYTINSLSSLNAYYSRGNEDIFSNLQSPGRSFPQDFIDDRLGNTNLRQIFEQTRYGIGYAYTRPESLRFNAEYGKFERDYPNPVFNQEDKRLSMSVNFPVSQNLDFSLYGRISDMEFPGQFRDQRRREVGARGNYRITQRLSLRVAVSAIEQNGLVNIDEYDGYNALLSITYRHDG